MTPAELLLGRTLRSRLDALKPSLSTRIERQQTQQKHHHDRRARRRTFHVGDLVLARNFGRGSRWVRGCILQQTGPVSFKVKLEGGVTWRRHQDHIRKRASQDSSPSAEAGESEEESSYSPSIGMSGGTSEPTDPVPAQMTVSPPSQTPPVLASETVDPDEAQSASQPTSGHVPSPKNCASELSPQPLPSSPAAQRYPRRQRGPPQRYTPDDWRFPKGGV